MYQTILPPHHVHAMGQPQQMQQHHHLVTTTGVARQRPLARRNLGAMHRETPVQVKSPVEFLRSVGEDYSADNSDGHHSKGVQRGRGSFGPRHYDMMHLNAGVESTAGKNQNDSRSRKGDEMAAMDKGHNSDGKRAKRQHKFYAKTLGGAQGNLGTLNSVCHGTGQCVIPVDGRGAVPSYHHHHHHLGVHKRRFPMEARPFTSQGERGGRKMSAAGGSTTPDSCLGSVLRYSLVVPMAGVLSAPERFLSRAHLVNVKSPPPDLLKGGEWDKLSEGIWDKFFSNQQSEETFGKKMVLWRCLYALIKNTFPRYGLYLVGSTMSGFGSDSSDVDMCLLVRYSEMDQRSEAVGHLEQILHYLKRCDYINNVELIQAKVPILKFRDSRHGLEVDLNCNNSVGIRNTHLLHCYSQLDWRVKPLVLVVKLWAHKHNINDAKKMTISSYSLTLMVINYLQCGVTPPVLPCLHVMYQGKFSPHSDIQRINLMEEMSPYKSENDVTLGELFLGFLHHYAYDFDFSQEAVSVRLASRILIEDCRRVRSYKNDPHQWKYLCIEEPFDLTNTARSVYDRDVFERVKHVFRSSWQKLNDSKTIDCLFED